MSTTLPSAPSPGSSPQPMPGRAGSGLAIPRFFTRDGRHPFETVAWERRDALIQDEEGRVLFEPKGVEFPSGWSATAASIVASKYFHGSGEGREHSLKQLIGRVADTLGLWGEEAGWFASAEDALAFRHELTFLLLDQRMAFNSPVWFNVGIEPRPQCSACFINSVDDSMESILDLVKTDEATGNWQQSHFEWRILSVVWAGILYVVTLPLWLLLFFPGWIAWAVISLWFLYRVVRGWVKLNSNTPMPQ